MKGTRLRWAARALRTEVLNFRFDYPLEILPEAGTPGELRYYVYSNRLFLDDQVFDDRGVPLKRYRLLGDQYNPLFVAWWGLHRLQRYVRDSDPRALEQFMVQIKWLRAAAWERVDGSVVWPCHFSAYEGRCHLAAPWISGMYQGVVISALVRAHRLTGDARLLELAGRGARVFEKSVEEGGVRTIENGAILYEEYPAYPLPRVFDGFLFSLLGLHDLAVETGDATVRRLFDDGVAGLREALPLWDYRGKWSWYGTHGYLCPPHYHALNWRLLALLGRLAVEPVLARQAEGWDPAGLSWRDRIEVYTVFLATKNAARFRLPNMAGA